MGKQAPLCCFDMNQPIAFAVRLYKKRKEKFEYIKRWNIPAVTSFGQPCTSRRRPRTIINGNIDYGIYLRRETYLLIQPFFLFSLCVMFFTIVTFVQSSVLPAANAYRPHSIVIHSRCVVLRIATAVDAMTFVIVFIMKNEWNEAMKFEMKQGDLDFHRCETPLIGHSFTFIQLRKEKSYLAHTDMICYGKHYTDCFSVVDRTPERTIGASIMHGCPVWGGCNQTGVHRASTKVMPFHHR